MKVYGLWSLVSGILLVCSCNQTEQFTQWMTENFEATPITQKATHTISFRNPHSMENQHLLGVDFSLGTNEQGNFRIEKVEVGNRIVSPKQITIPPGSSLNLVVTYEPRQLLPEEDHRSVVFLVYDQPRTGIIQVELVGKASPGPNGEESVAVGMKECTPAAGVACFEGVFEFEIPKIMSKGPMNVELTGPIAFALEGREASLMMDSFPVVLIPLKGNGPGEPLEGQPVSAVSIIITGMPGKMASGTFDGLTMELEDIGFKVRVVLGELNMDQVTPGIATLVNFNIEDLKLITQEPFLDGRVLFKIETTLAEKPSGNPLFDQFLGGAQIIVRLKGTLTTPS